MRFLAATLLLACAACGGDDGSGPGSGETCGGFAGLPCPDNEYCDFTDETCGIADDTGTCRAQPTVCPDLYAPVMGKDGRVYGNACEAHANGVDDCGPAPAR